MDRKTARVSFKTDDLKPGEFIAYPSTFIRTPDDYGDVVAPGAFLKTIDWWKNSGKTLPVLYMHRMDDPEYNIGGVEDMGEDAHGWWIKAQLDLDNPVAQQVYRLVKAGRLSQLSFAYDVLDSATVTLDDGTTARELREVKVYEASLVPVGANQDTSVEAMKAAPKGDIETSAPSAVRSEEDAPSPVPGSVVVALTKVCDGLRTAVDALQSFLGSLPGAVDDSGGDTQAQPVSDANAEEPKAKAEERKTKALGLAASIAIALDGGKE